MGMLGKMIQKRLQKKGPKSQILVLFDVSKHRKRNAKLENHRGGFRRKSVRGVANFGWLTPIDGDANKAKGRRREALSPGMALWGAPKYQRLKQLKQHNQERI